MNTNRIIELYKKKLMTQETLAKKIGISKTALSQILLGNSEPKMSTVEKIAKALDVQPSYLLDDDTKETNITNSNNTIHNSNGKIQISIETKDKEIQMLKEQLKLKDEIIELLREAKKK